ncbi:MAG: ABC transporter permease subunit [Anaerolineales bacterium]|nr:ABC transporter permease subunit [Anaerolineales bacterium]
MQLQEDATNIFRGILTPRRRRDLREYLTGYLMILPAILLIFIFGIFPVGFALYVSLHKWILVPSDFRGLGNYVTAIDNLTYIVLFGVGIGALIGTGVLLRRIYRETFPDRLKIWLLGFPAIFHTTVVILFIRWIFFQLPEFLDIANKMRGLERTRDLFIGLLRDAFYAETVHPFWEDFIRVLAIAIIAGLIALFFWRSAENIAYQARFTIAWLALVVGIGLVFYTFQSIQAAYALAVETGEDPGIWPQVITVGSGLILLVLAWLLWRSAGGQPTNRSFALRIIGALALMVGAVMLIIEIPTIVASGDPDLWNGLKVTVFFSLGTVPVQLGIALFLAVLLFQKLRGSDIFRTLYFLPYVTPVVASATVFRLLFSDRQSAPINTMLSYVGISPQLWLREPDGVFTILAAAVGLEGFPEEYIPAWVPPDMNLLLTEWLPGPSMALVVILTLSVWMFVGYNVVIYLAGLGNIPSELTEAAAIDGANRWDIFRNVTFPLLSPTTYFLSLLAVMGTFKAFNTIWVLRIGQALGTTDTFSVVIFEEFFQKSRYGYASALAFVLFGIILVLTFFNSKIQGSRVFYG